MANTTTTRTVELNSSEVENILREHLGIAHDRSITIDWYGSGCEVTWVVEETNG